LGQGKSRVIKIKVTAASKRTDTNVLPVAILLQRRSPHCFRYPGPPNWLEGPDTGCSGFGSSFKTDVNTSRRQATCYSVSLQPGNGRRARAGIPVHVFREGRIKLPPGSRGSIKGVTIASPFVSVDTVSIGIAVFQTILRPDRVRS